MKIKSIRWQLSLSYAGIAFLAALVLGGIMIFILSWNFKNLEKNSLIDGAKAIGDKSFFFLEDDLPEEYIDEVMRRLSFYIDAQIRFLDGEENVLADSGLPQSYTKISIDKEEYAESLKEREDIFISREKGRLFSSWLVSIQEDIQTNGVVDAEIRSDQVVTEAFYDENKQIVGYVELSNGPAYGRDILLQVAGGWAIAALLAVILAGFAGMWVSLRFSNPIESLTHTTTKMAAGDLSIRSEITRLDEFGTLSKSFDQMADNIEANDQMLRRFVADAAHELGTPLTAIRTNIEMIDDEQVSTALSQVDRMDTLTNSLLELSNLEVSKPDFVFEDIDLNSLLNELAELFASRAEQQNIEFSLDIGVDPVLVEGDLSQLSSMAKNLLDNAIKFTPRGGKVWVKLSQKQDGAEFSVTDTGIGILEDDIPHIFSRFHRGSNTSEYPGNGLGLAIVKVIADKHNAEIEVRQLTPGTEILVKIPL